MVWLRKDVRVSHGSDAGHEEGADTDWLIQKRQHLGVGEERGNVAPEFQGQKTDSSLLLFLHQSLTRLIQSNHIPS